MTTNDNQPLLKPLDAKLVLLVAIFLPGMGQVINNAPKRGFFMACFMIILGLITFNLAQPHTSMVGKLSGGVFIYAISILDAYYWAKYRMEIFSSEH
jgi:hypothetical protein